MARVETVFEHRLTLIEPDAINCDLEARPGPVSANEAERVEALAQSMRELGQIVPCVVEYRDGEPWLVDGKRRLKAAKLLGNRLACIERIDRNGDALRAAIHANLQRRGYGPLQFAHLCAQLRKEHSWEGTKELAEYLMVSRATISQHDKLLKKPDGMDGQTYQSLLEKVVSGRMGADTAFYTLTHVEPARAAEVLQKASERADKPSTITPARKTSPRGQKSQETASHKTVKPPSAPPKPPVIKKADVRAAAREAKAIKSDIQRTTADLFKLFEVLKSGAYPDTMRSFVSLIEEWWRADASEKDVIAHWNQIAMLVEAELARTRCKPTPGSLRDRGRPVRRTSK